MNEQLINQMTPQEKYDLLDKRLQFHHESSHFHFYLCQKLDEEIKELVKNNPAILQRKIVSTQDT